MSADANGTAVPDGPPPGVRIGVDVGSVRIGVAASDPAGLVATPVCTVRRAPDTPGTGQAEVIRIVGERDAAVVYVGLPRHLSGAEGSASAAARTYAQALAGAIDPTPVRMVDERLSTVAAHQALHSAGRSARSRRDVVDQVAAVVILQSALDAERASGERVGEQVLVVTVDEAGPRHVDEVGGPVGRTDQMRGDGRAEGVR